MRTVGWALVGAMLATPGYGQNPSGSLPSGSSRPIESRPSVPKPLAQKQTSARPATPLPGPAGTVRPKKPARKGAPIQPATDTGSVTGTVDETKDGIGTRSTLLITEARETVSRRLQDPSTAEFQNVRARSVENLKGEPIQVVCGEVSTAKSVDPSRQFARWIYIASERSAFVLGRNTYEDGVTADLLKSFCGM